MRQQLDENLFRIIVKPAIILGQNYPNDNVDSLIDILIHDIYELNIKREDN